MTTLDEVVEEHEQRMQNDPEYSKKIQDILSKGGLVKGITTPIEISSSIRKFCLEISNGNEPFMVDVDPPLWSRKACCEMNSRKLAEHEGGGVLVHGYKIWANEKYAEAIPHCILERPDGSYIDPTFNKDGERRILFVRDNGMKTTTLEHLGHKPCMALDPELDLIVGIKILSESRIALQPMSEEEAWASEITYTEYLKARE